MINIIEKIQSVCGEISKDIVHDINGVVLCETSDNLFNLYSKTHAEVKKYCRDHGFDIQKIIFITAYDSTVSDFYDNKQLINLKTNSEDRLTIIKNKNSELVAYVFMSTHIYITEK
jgi:hypothetical protein